MIALILMIAVKIMFPDIFTAKIIVQVTSPDVIVESQTIETPDIPLESNPVTTTEDILITEPSETSAVSEEPAVSEALVTSAVSE